LSEVGRRGSDNFVYYPADKDYEIKDDYHYLNYIHTNIVTYYLVFVNAIIFKTG